MLQRGAEWRVSAQVGVSAQRALICACAALALCMSVRAPRGHCCRWVSRHGRRSLHRPIPVPGVVRLGPPHHSRVRGPLPQALAHEHELAGCAAAFAPRRAASAHYGSRRRGPGWQSLLCPGIADARAGIPPSQSRGRRVSRRSRSGARQRDPHRYYWMCHECESGWQAPRTAGTRRQRHSLLRSETEGGLE